MAMRVEFLVFGILLIAAVSIIPTSEAADDVVGTTTWPEICRVMSLYRNCTDSSFRIACTYLCSDDAQACLPKNMIYIPSKGKCYGITKTAQNLWAFAWDSCEWYSATLAVLKDASDAEVIKYLQDKVKSTQSKILVGAINVGKEDIWVHVDGTEVDGSFWSSSKPTGENDVNCMYSDKSQQYKQRADNCGQNRGFVCEFW